MAKCNLITLLCIWHIFIFTHDGAPLLLSAAARKKRAIPLLLFPRTAPTRIQWIIGVGIPLEDLVFEAMTTGYVIKAEYFLPYEAQQLHMKTTLNIAGRNDDGSGNSTSTDTNTNDTNTNDTNGHHHTNTSTPPPPPPPPPMDWKQNLRTMMQASGKALSSYRWALYKALEHLAIKMGLSGRACVLKSICESAELHLHMANGLFGELLHILLTPSSSVDELSVWSDNEYFQAEYLGRAGGDCNRVYKDCAESLLDRFSDIYTFTEDIGRLSGMHDLLNAIQ